MSQINGDGAVEVQYSHQGFEDAEPPSPTEVRRILRVALPSDAHVTVRFVDVEESQALNLRYLNKDRPANVLAFPYTDTAHVSGDVAICPEVVATESKQSGVPAAERYALLLVHAALHLQGMEHDTPETAKAMEQVESRLMTGLGLPDPYKLD